ncbi:MAG: nucleoside-triphosphatase [Bacteroidota bacterium]
MNPKQILIVSAAKHSGKTTRLIHWCQDRNDVFGILTPVVDGRRVFVDAHTKETFRMEATETETSILEVGKYRFSKASFARASSIMLDALQQENGFLIIDEIGPLELRGSGFSETITRILEDERNGVEIIIVVREELLEQVIRRFGLDRFTVRQMVL